jgi:dTDP-4-amino-4,6-dideoxygalactose transaminase
MAELAVLGGSPAFSEPLHVGRPNLPDRNTFNGLLDEMFRNRWFTNYGPLVQRFQSALQDRLRVTHCIPLCNGTIALELACRAIGLSGEVIVPSYTFIATAHALKWQQITPVFCDMRENDFTIDPKAVEDLITERTTGIIGVHVYGNPCDHRAIRDIASRHRLKVVYDAAHAFTNEVEGVPVCRLGDISVLSFHATKFFSSFEGGAVATDDDELAGRIRLMMNFGFGGRHKDRVDFVGINGKMTEVCSAMGLAMLDRVEELREINRVNHACYGEHLNGIPGVRLCRPSPELTAQNWQYVIVRVDREVFGLTRDELVQVLEAENVLARRYFYPGCHRMEPYVNSFPNKGRHLPVTDRVSETVVSLPTGEAADREAIGRIAGIIRLAGDSADAVKKALHGR